MSPRNKEQNEQVKDERREQLLLAALKVFSHRGLVATKIGDIALEAGLSHGLVYHYFKSKDEIFTELARRATMGSTGMVKQIETLPMEPLEKIRLMTDGILKAIEETADTAYYFFLMVQAFISDVNPEEVKQLLAETNVSVEVMVRIIMDGQAKGQIREGNPLDYAFAYWAAIQGLAVYKISSGQGFKMPDSSVLVGMFAK